MRYLAPVTTLRWALPLLLSVAPARAEVPKDVLDVVTDAADSLANNDANRFLDLFDGRMPGFDSLYSEIHYMVAAEDEIESSVEIVSGKEAGSAYELELDWVLQFGMETPRRAVIKCKIERQGQKWKFTSLTPVEFFKV